ncbi:hypothetical protein CMO96_04125 [Candidatus Woesebacteria bacterium]|nr:hypothetical protein [Candidatus Woesebacteria bacterium]
MKRFEYRARDKTGKVVRGKVEANAAPDAARLLRDRGLTAFKLSQEKEFFLLQIINGFVNQVGLSEVADFTRQFSTMVTAGLPITDALVILREQSKPKMKPVINQLVSDIQGGSSLSGALEKHPKVFTPVYTSLVRAGETGGVLDKILERLADNLESQREFHSKVKGAMIYPVIVVIGMFAVGTIMMVFVIPRLTQIYEEFDAELPITTRIVIGISEVMQKMWWAIPIVGVGLVWGFGAFSRTKVGRAKIDALKFKIPVFGELQKKVVLTEFARTLGLLVGAGIPILEGLRVVGGAVGNVVVSDAIKRASEKVEKGFALSYALSQETKVFPPLLFQMLAVGEETGKVDETLLKVSKVFEQDTSHAVKNLTAAIEPIIMVILGISIGFLVLSIILPIYNLTSQF